MNNAKDRRKRTILWIRSRFDVSFRAFMIGRGHAMQNRRPTFRSICWKRHDLPTPGAVTEDILDIANFRLGKESSHAPYAENHNAWKLLFLNQAQERRRISPPICSPVVNRLLKIAKTFHLEFEEPIAKSNIPYQIDIRFEIPSMSLVTIIVVWTHYIALWKGQALQPVGIGLFRLCGGLLILCGKILKS